MIPKRLVTTWICAPDGDLYTEAHRETFARCLTSWTRLMPDYALTVVTLGNLFDLGEDAWVRERLRERNYIGASQWARLHWLQKLGGVYVDMDVEAVRRFDPLLTHDFVVAHIGNGMRFANNAVMLAAKDHPFLAAQMARVKNCNPRDPEFGNATGPFQLTTLLEQRGWNGSDANAVVAGRDGRLTVLRSAAFYPYPWTRAFAPQDVQDDTYAIHWWGASWRARGNEERRRPA